MKHAPELLSENAFPGISFIPTNPLSRPGQWLWLPWFGRAGRRRFSGWACWEALLGGFRIKTSASRYSNGTHACMCKPTRLSTRRDVCGAHAFTPLVRIRLPTSGSFCLGRRLHPRALGFSPCGACQNGANIKLSFFIFENKQGFLSILMAWKRLFAMPRHSTIGAAHPL